MSRTVLPLLLLASACGRVEREDRVVDAGPDAAGDGLDRYGYVQIGSSTVLDEGGEPTGYYEVFVGFSESDAAENPCVLETRGACEISRCTDGPQPSTRAVSAGHVGIAGLPALLELDPDAANQYPSLEGDVALWTGGEPITVSAAGAEIPAFSEELVAPPVVQVAEPAAAERLSFSSGEDLHFTWQGIAQPATFLVYAGASVTGGSVTIRCSFDATKGVGVVPAEVTGELPAGSTGILNVSVLDQVTATPSGWRIDVLALSLATTPDEVAYYFDFDVI